MELEAVISLLLLLHICDVPDLKFWRFYIGCTFMETQDHDGSMCYGLDKCPLRDIYVKF